MDGGVVVSGSTFAIRSRRRVCLYLFLCEFLICKEREQRRANREKVEVAGGGGVGRRLACRDVDREEQQDAPVCELPYESHPRR